MNKRILLILSAIIIVLAGAIYYFTKMSSEPLVVYTPDLPIPKYSDYQQQEEICKNLSKNECAANDNCTGIFTSSCPDCDDLSVFTGCVPSNLNPSEIEHIKIECAKIGGEFDNDWYAGATCLCDDPQYMNTDNVVDGCLKDLIDQLEKN